MARTADDCITRLSKLCLALPEAAQQDCEGHSSFLVRKRPFGYFLNNHHGDGIVSIAVKVLPGENKALATAQPNRFYLPAYIGPRGWVALRLDRGAVDWKEVSDLLTLSYRLIAPKTLVKRAGGNYASSPRIKSS
jgi:predicted DNA-binding protein (MmcQ/YjbR family)